MSVSEGRPLRRLDVRREDGQTLPLLAIFLPLFLICLALVVDGSLAFVKHQSLQNAADAAALAAAQDIGPNGCVNCGADASAYASVNGAIGLQDQLPRCADVGPGVSCWQWPYVDSNGVSYSDRLQVKLFETHQTFFGSILANFGIYDPNTSATAAIGGLTVGKPPDVTFAALNSSNDNHTLVIRSGGTLNVGNKIYVNSSSGGDAFDVFGTGGEILAPDIVVHGGWESHDAGQVWVGGSKCALQKEQTPSSGPQTGCPHIGQPLLVDPFAGVVFPPTPDPSSQVSTCTITNPCYDTGSITPTQLLDGNIAASTTGATSTIRVQGDTTGNDSGINNNAWLSIDGERMQVTNVSNSSPSGYTLKVTRGQLKSTASAHTVPTLNVVAEQRVGNEATLTTDAPHGLDVGDWVKVNLGGSGNSAFNGIHQITDITDDEEHAHPVEFSYDNTGPDVGGAEVVSVSRTNGIATVTTSTPHGLNVGDPVDVHIATGDKTFEEDGDEGDAPTVLSVPTPNSFTYLQTKYLNSSYNVSGSSPITIKTIARFAGTATIGTNSNLVDSNNQTLTNGFGATMNVSADSSFNATTPITVVNNNTFTYPSSGANVPDATLPNPTFNVNQVQRSAGLATLTTNDVSGLTGCPCYIAVNVSDSSFDGIYQVGSFVSNGGNSTVSYNEPNDSAHPNVTQTSAGGGAVYKMATPLATVSRSNGVATVTTASAHGLNNNQYVTIDAGDNSFDGTFQITKIDATTFTFAQSGLPDVAAGATTGGVVQVTAANNPLDVTHGQCTTPCTVTPFAPATGTVTGQPKAIDPSTDGANAVAAPLFEVFSLPGNPPTAVLGGTPTSPAEYRVPAGTSDTLNPGTYWGGICIGAPAGTTCGPQTGGKCDTSSASPTTVTLNAGVYIMAGGGFFVCGNTTLDASAGVMIYNTVDSSTSAATGKLDQVKINTNGNVTLKPPVNGQYTGMTIYEGPDPTSSANPNPNLQLSPNSKCDGRNVDLTDVALVHSANGLSGISGTVYAPAQYALFADSLSGTAELAVIAGCIFIDGADSTFNFSASGGLFGRGPGLIG
jgi:hypothetical protein